MKSEKTLAIIKPDGVRKNLIGEICKRIEKEGLKITRMEMIQMNKAKAEGFYAVHKGKPFFDGLVEFMSSGPVVVMCLEGNDAVKRWRKLTGVTNPKEAGPGTIRGDFADSIGENVVHGSDAPETGAFETSYFFDKR